MKVTQCDLCKKVGNPFQICRWVRLRFAEGELANWLRGTDREYELCEDCFRRLSTPSTEV